MPEGVYNVLPGKGTVAGKALVESQSVDIISFAGRQETAKQILKTTAQTLKKTVINTGGKSIHVVLPDCDLDAATYTIVLGVMFGNGQVATASSRVFVHNKIHEKFLDKLLARFRESRLGDPFDEQTTLGPLISKFHLSDALEFIESAKKEGAKICLGGNTPDIPKGYFINPTILERVTQTMKIFYREIFAPVLSIIVFDDSHKLPHLINNIVSCYCITIWTRSLNEAFSLSKEIRCANIWVNTYNVLQPSIPFGGISPGCVSKDLGLQSINHYTYSKSILVDFS
jgi:aldehyde dehydrogenase (NAD+)